MALERRWGAKAHGYDAATEAQRLPKPAADARRFSQDMAQRHSHPGNLIQRVRSDPRSLTPGDIIQLQRMVGNRAVNRLLSGVNTRPNQTGLPEKLKLGVERLSGQAMDDVEVHYNSSRPAQLNAMAYAQGRDIYIAPGEERYLPHEAWHVVQQAQARVQPTMQMNEATPVNDDEGLEREADVMGARATAGWAPQEVMQPAPSAPAVNVAQLGKQKKKSKVQFHPYKLQHEGMKVRKKKDLLELDMGTQRVPTFNRFDPDPQVQKMQGPHRSAHKFSLAKYNRRAMKAKEWQERLLNIHKEFATLPTFTFPEGAALKKQLDASIQELQNSDFSVMDPEDIKAVIGTAANNLYEYEGSLPSTTYPSTDEADLAGKGEAGHYRALANLEVKLQGGGSLSKAEEADMTEPFVALFDLGYGLNKQDAAHFQASKQQHMLNLKLSCPHLHARYENRFWNSIKNRVQTKN